MRIVFTSCCDQIHDDQQRAWEVVADQRPDHLVLLGDNIYMDYKSRKHRYRNGEPKNAPPHEFAAEMHKRYARQWAVPSFARAVRAAGRVHAIWDDHDFGWNNATGAGAAKETAMPADRRRLSRALFDEFRRALDERPNEYWGNPRPDGVVKPEEDLGTIAKTVDLEPGVRLHLLDGRSFRGDDGKGLLGEAQKIDLAAALLPMPGQQRPPDAAALEPGINLIASGTTLEDWQAQGDFDWLRAHANAHRMLVLSGDIHEPRFSLDGVVFDPSSSSDVLKTGESLEGRLLEATASALAQPGGKLSGFISAAVGKKSEVFGLLDVGAERLKISLWHKGQVVQQQSIDRLRWAAV